VVAKIMWDTTFRRLGVPEASDRNAASRRYVGSGRRIALHCSTPERRTGTPHRTAHPCAYRYERW
jgi:hypothetical protein